MSFKENLAEKLDDTNISALARKSGLSDETIRSILAGRSEDPLLSTVIKIAQGLEISLDELVFRKRAKTDDFGEVPFDKKLWEECTELVERYIEDNKLANNIKLKQLLHTIDAILDYSTNNNLQTIDEKFAIWTCKKNFGK